MNSRSSAPILHTYGMESTKVPTITRSCFADFTSRKTRPIRKILKNEITFKPGVFEYLSSINSRTDTTTIKKSNILCPDFQYLPKYAVILMAASNMKITMKTRFMISKT